MTGLGVAVVVSSGPDDVVRGGWNARTVGWMGTVLFAGCLLWGLWNLWQATNAPRPIVVLTGDTWHDVRLSRHPIPWRHVASVAASRAASPGEYYVVVDLTEEGWASTELTRRGEYWRSWSEAQGQPGLVIVAFALSLGRDDLVVAMARHVPAVTDSASVPDGVPPRGSVTQGP